MLASVVHTRRCNGPILAATGFEGLPRHRTPVRKMFQLAFRRRIKAQPLTHYSVKAVKPRPPRTAPMVMTARLRLFLSRPDFPLVRCRQRQSPLGLVGETTRRLVSPPQRSLHVLLPLPSSPCAPGHSSSRRQQSEGGMLRQRSGGVRKLSLQDDASAKEGRPSSFEEDCNAVEECNLLVNARLDIPK